MPLTSSLLIGLPAAVFTPSSSTQPPVTLRAFTMKPTTFLSFIGLLATSAIASPASAEAAAEAALAAECGSLGVMKYDMAELPEGVDPSGIRRCAEHPLGRYPGLAPEDMSDAPG